MHIGILNPANRHHIGNDTALPAHLIAILSHVVSKPKKGFRLKNHPFLSNALDKTVYQTPQHIHRFHDFFIPGGQQLFFI